MENSWAAACNTHVSGSQKVTIMWALRPSSGFSIPSAQHHKRSF